MMSKNIAILHYPEVQNKRKSTNLSSTEQQAKAFWFTGLSASGKTTIGSLVAAQLAEQNILVKLLDGDLLRNGINSDLGFTTKDRMENIRRAAEISNLFLQSGVITLNCFITPTNDLRNLARSIIGAKNFVEIFVNAPVDICSSRDRKGLYQKACSGSLPDFPGVNSPFETPSDPDLIIDSSETDIVGCVAQVLRFLLPLVTVR